MELLQYHYQLLIGAIAIYLITSINFAYIFVKRFRHADIRQLGSGNPGATNVVRNFGLKLGTLTFLCDFVKGIIAALVGRYLILALTGNVDVAVFAGYLYGLCAVLGHIFPVFLGFRGGKGIATSLGLFAVLHPIFTLCTLVAAAVIIFTTDKVSIFALLHITLQTVYTAVILFAYSTAELSVRIASFACVAVMWLIIILAHRANIARLLNGTEKGMGIKKLLFKPRSKEESASQSVASQSTASAMQESADEQTQPK